MSHRLTLEVTNNEKGDAHANTSEKVEVLVFLIMQ